MAAGPRPAGFGASRRFNARVTDRRTAPLRTTTRAWQARGRSPVPSENLERDEGVVVELLVALLPGALMLRRGAKSRGQTLTGHVKLATVTLADGRAYLVELR